MMSIGKEGTFLGWIQARIKDGPYTFNDMQKAHEIKRF